MKSEIDAALANLDRRHGKYGVSKPEDRTADNITFASKREMMRYLELRASLRAGIIHDLKLQPRYPLEVNGRHVCTYVADFRYQGRDGSVTIEDVKGCRTAVYKLKRALFEACFPGLRITET